MIKLASEIKNNLLNANHDIVSVLRKAHVLALKTKNKEMDDWILFELNGYPFNNDVIPEYRNVRGQVKAYNPYRGYIPVFIADEKTEKELSTRKIASSMPEILDFLADLSHEVFMRYPAEVQRILNDELSPGMNFQYSILIQKHTLSNVVECVRTKLIEWIITLVDENDEIIYSAKEDHVFICGDNNVVQLQKGDNNLISSNYIIDDSFVDELKIELEKENIEQDDKNDLMSMLDEIKQNVNKPGE